MTTKSLVRLLLSGQDWWLIIGIRLALFPLFQRHEDVDLVILPVERRVLHRSGEKTRTRRNLAVRIAKNEARCGAHGRSQQTLIPTIALACSYHLRDIHGPISSPGSLAHALRCMHTSDDVQLLNEGV